MVPEAEGFLGGFGITEIDGAGEKLPAAVDLAGGEQLLRAQEAELFAEVGAEFVLAAVAAGKREVAGAIAATAGEVGDDLGVLVVGGGGDLEACAERAKAAEVVLDRGEVGRFGSGSTGVEEEKAGEEREDG